MKNSVIYLSSCDTCRRILKDLNLDDSFELQDVKKEHISAEHLDWLRTKVNGYSDLLNTRAQKLKTLTTHWKNLSDKEIRDLILSDYTFIKRPIIVVDENPFIGNSKNTISEVKSYLESKN